MRGGQSLGDPQCQRGGTHGILRPIVLDEFSQRLTGDKLHFQEVIAAIFANGVNGDDVGMIQSSRGTALVGEPFDVCGITLDEFWRQDFQCAIAVQVHMPRQVDASHRPRTQQRIALVAANPLADQFIDLRRLRRPGDRLRLGAGGGGIDDLSFAHMTDLPVEGRTTLGTDLPCIRGNK